jgi:hypothetical protein
VWRRVSQQGTGAEAPSRSDSGRRRGRAASRGGGGHERRERSGGQVGRDWVREARQHNAALTRGSGSIVPPDSVLNTSNQIKSISKGLKFAQNLTNPKGAFPCSKNWK